MMKISYFALWNVLMALVPSVALAQSGLRTGSTPEVVLEQNCVDCVVVASIGTGLMWPGRASLDDEGAHTSDGGLGSETGGLGRSSLYSRLAYVGLDGHIDALRLTRQYNLQYLVLVDMVGNGSTVRSLAPYSLGRADLSYSTPFGRGLGNMGLYSFAESPYSIAAVRAYGAVLGYAAGPLNLSLAHQRKRNLLDANGILVPLDTSARNTQFAANLNFGSLTAYAAYGLNKGEGSSPWDPSNPYGALALSGASNDSRDVLLGLSIPWRSFAINASYIRKDDRSLLNHDVNKMALGLTYSLSSRFDVYMSGANIKNKNGAFYGLGNAEALGRSERALSLGLRRTF